jgi:hypothetical protein
MEQFSREHQEYLTRKLKHYNTWLGDLDRDFTSTYPGFPEDFPEKKTKKSVAKDVSKAPAAAPVRKIRVSSKGATKAERAVEIVASNQKLSRVNMITLLQEQLGMSKAGATTYYYNSMKKLGYA